MNNLALMTCRKQQAVNLLTGQTNNLPHRETYYRLSGKDRSAGDAKV